MSNIHIIHALDETTEFLNVFNKHFPDQYFIIEPNKSSVNKSLSFVEQVPEEDMIVFLGHGHSTGLYTPESDTFEKEVFINVELGNDLFKNRLVFLLTCNSNQFIKKLSDYRNIIGFGNIISSMHEVNSEAEVTTGIYRNLSIGDVEFFNESYCGAVISALNEYQNSSLSFIDLPKIIEFNINQRINETLLNKEIKNRTEISRLLFEFRNEMVCL